MANLVVVLIILIAVCSAVRYLVKAKKKGQACIGCPCASSCEKQHCDGKR